MITSADRFRNMLKEFSILDVYLIANIDVDTGEIWPSETWQTIEKGGAGSRSI